MDRYLYRHKYYGNASQLKWKIKQTGIKGKWEIHRNIMHVFVAKSGGMFVWNENSKEYVITADFKQSQAQCIINIVHRPCPNWDRL